MSPIKAAFACTWCTPTFLYSPVPDLSALAISSAFLLACVPASSALLPFFESRSNVHTKLTRQPLFF